MGQKEKLIKRLKTKPRDFTFDEAETLLGDVYKRQGWYYSHYALANGIWYALIVLGLISGIVSLVRKVRRMI